MLNYLICRYLRRLQSRNLSATESKEQSTLLGKIWQYLNTWKESVMNSFQRAFGHLKEQRRNWKNSEQILCFKELQDQLRNIGLNGPLNSRFVMAFIQSYSIQSSCHYSKNSVIERLERDLEARTRLGSSNE